MLHNFVTKFLLVITLLFVGVHSLTAELERYRTFVLTTFDLYDDDCYSMHYDFVKNDVLRSVFKNSDDCRTAYRSFESKYYVKCAADLYTGFMKVNRKNHRLCVYYGNAKYCNSQGRMNYCNKMMWD